VNDTTLAAGDTSFVVADASRFREGDLVRPGSGLEVMLVTAVNTATNTLTVVRGYGGTTQTTLTNGLALNILGNAALEGGSAVVRDKIPERAQQHRNIARPKR